MYKEIGDVFKYQGITLQVVENCNISCKGCLLLKAKECEPVQHCCNDCYFYETLETCDTILCCSTERKDHKDVIFKKVQ